MRRRIVPAVVAIAAAFMLTACSGATSEQAVTSDMVGSDGIAVAPMDAMMPGIEKSGGSLAPQEQSVIRTANLSIRVEDVGAATNDIRDLVGRRHGIISAEDSQVTGDSTYSTMTVQVPAADLDSLIDDVSALGDVDSVSVNAQDVTTQVVDLDARIKALQTSIDRMNDLLSQADQIDDLLAIETQLSTRQADLDSMRAQRAFLGDQVAMSAVSITMSPTTALTDVDAAGFLSGLRSGWSTFVSAIAVGVTALGFLLPFALILLLVLVPLVAIAVKQSRRRVPQHAADHDVAKEPVGSSPSGE